MELIRVSGRNSNAYCFSRMNNDKRKMVMLNKQNLIDELTDCMFNFFRRKYPDIAEGNSNRTFIEKFKSAINQQKVMPTAPPMSMMNEKNFSDIKGPSAPLFEDEQEDLTINSDTNIGGKSKKTKKNKNKKHYKKKNYYLNI